MLIVLLSRLRSPRQALLSEDELPSVTLLIAAYNEEAVIAKKLENSLSLNYPRQKLQILVAADGSDDRTEEIVKSYQKQGVELSFDPVRSGKLAAIGNALDKVRGEMIVFSDANNMFVENAIGELLKPFSDPKVGAVSGSKSIIVEDDLLGVSEGFYWRYESFIKQAESRFGSCVAISGEIWAIRRELFGMPPADIINDDFYLGMQVIRQGYNIAYAPEARSYEKVSPSAKGEKERRSRIVAGRYQFITRARSTLPLKRPIIMWQVFSHKLLRMSLPFAMLGALVCNALIAGISLSNLDQLKGNPSNQFYILLLLFQIVFYLLAALGSKMKDKDDLIGKITYLPTFIVNSNFAALAGFFRFLTGHQTALWQRVQRS